MAPAAFEEMSKTVCVMDASGRLGSTLVHRLHHRGYTVHAAIQNQGELKMLKGLWINNKKLRVCHTDLLDYHSITDALKGCCGLFYSFEVPSDYPSYDECMAEIEVRAAHNVVEACAHTDTIGKVVFSSSATAVIWSDTPNTTSSHLDEKNWSDINLCKKFKLWHALSKTLAEKTAWALAMDRGLNMISINGGLLMPPDLTVMNPYLKGATEMYQAGVFVTVDLGFIVDAHICVFEDVSSFGRYLCFDHVISCDEDAIKLIGMLLPPSQSTFPPRLEDVRVYPPRMSSKKLKNIMLDYKRDVQVPNDETDGLIR